MYNYKNAKQDGFYTDLACERRKCTEETEGVSYQKTRCPVGFWERVVVKDENGEREIGRPVGIYDTLTLARIDRLDEELVYDAREEVAKRLCRLLSESDIIPGRILVVGFGNRELTPDSIGAKTATRVKPTLHISRFDPGAFEALDCSEIAVLTPDVCVHSGLNSADTVRDICRSLRPDVVIAIDAISTSSPQRLGSTVQICNTGIFPGGVGNLAAPITASLVGAPVIGIGVPTVIDARAFCSSGFDTALGETYLVSPREIDEITDGAAEIIGEAINQAFGISPI